MRFFKNIDIFFKTILELNKEIIEIKRSLKLQEEETKRIFMNIGIILNTIRSHAPAEIVQEIRDSLFELHRDVGRIDDRTLEHLSKKGGQNDKNDR